MKVVHALGWYFPDSRGGTEVYVASLARELAALGVNAAIAAPHDGAGTMTYEHEGIAVFRYPVSLLKSPSQQQGLTPHAEFALFEAWLAGQGAEVFHQHSWTYGCGLHHLRAARALGMKTVLSVHVPGPVCLRGTMLRDGHSPCDARVSPSTCARCWLQQRGLPSPWRDLVALLPAPVAAACRPLGRAGTALAAAALAADHRQALLAGAAEADHVVAVCAWLQDALLACGVPANKLSLNRQGVAAPVVAARPARTAGQPLRIGYVGRWDPLKGVDVIVRAVLAQPAEVPVELHVHAVPSPDPVMQAYQREVEALAAGDARVHLHTALLPAEVAGFLASVDILAVPSQGFETGPLVVLEAFAAGTPVLGSALGGIAELVRHGQDGWLLPHDEPAAWQAAVSRLAADPAQVRQAAQAILPVRTMAAVAADCHGLYRQLLARR